MINGDTIRIKFTEAYNYTTWVQYEHRINNFVYKKKNQYQRDKCTLYERR